MVYENKFGFKSVVSCGEGICIFTTSVLKMVPINRMLSLCFDKINFNSNYKTTLFENCEKVHSFTNNYRDPSNRASKISKSYIFGDSVLLKMFYSPFYVNFVLKRTWNTFIVSKHIPFEVYPIKLAKPHNLIHLGIMFFLKIVFNFLE